MTLGDLKFRLVKMFPGVDLDIIEGFIGDRYAEILGEIPWQRQNVESILQTIAPYTTGTLTLTNGSNAVLGVGTAFIAAMTGRGLRTTGRTEIYQFTQTGATAGTLDRPYEGPSGSLIGYTIFQHIYVMPSDCRILEEGAFSGFDFGPLQRLSHTELNHADPGRNDYGVPRVWATYMDDGSTPPRLQVEFSPIPDAVYGIPFVYGSDLSLPGTGVPFQAWMQPAALVEGVTAKIKAQLKDYVGAQLHLGRSRDALSNMRSSEAQGMAPAVMKLPSHYTSHRYKRWCR